MGMVEMVLASAVALVVVAMAVLCVMMMFFHALVVMRNFSKLEQANFVVLFVAMSAEIVFVHESV